MKNSNVPKISGLNLLGTNSMKIAKGFDASAIRPILTAILYLMPDTILCPYARECVKLCLVSAGQGGMSQVVRNARIRKAKLWHSNRAEFLQLLHADIIRFKDYCDRRGFQSAIRLNGTSDLVWERFIDLSQYTDIVFYDYSKIPVKYLEGSSRHITYSYDPGNLIHVRDAVRAGYNLAVAFKGALPDSFLGLPVYSGDDTDLRFLDPKGPAICGLSYKRDTRKKTDRPTNTDNGFVVDMARNPHVDLLNCSDTELFNYHRELRKVYADLA
jgi:hypothetical protein